MGGKFKMMYKINHLETGIKLSLECSNSELMTFFIFNEISIILMVKILSMNLLSFTI